MARLDSHAYASRVAALRDAMRERGLAAVVLAGPESIYHQTGLDHLGYFALTLLVVPVAGPPVLIARQMEEHTLRAQVPHVRHAAYTDGEDPAEVAARTLLDSTPPGSRVGVEEQSMFLPPALLHRMRAMTPDLVWTDCSALPAALRMIKTDAELDCVRQAAEVSDVAMRTALATAAPGVNERTVAARTHQAMIEAGGEPPGFVPLIRSVARLPQEHVTWSDHVLRHGEALFVELSGCVRRYHAPMSRVVHCGEAAPGAEPAAEAARAGQEAARAALVPGAFTREVYAAWEDTVAEATGVRQRRHHCGYLTGIGFSPSWVGGGDVLGIRADGGTVVRAGMVFHLMSWVTSPVSHVVSDTAVVTEDGCRLLTRTPRELVVAPAAPDRPARSP
ncbi:Xaa-Pro aminopeptidase [Streptomyces brasiliensis]|uniref:Xaa-Pro aminopeptidase n=1 Tax=Streptomyces brasiliensis TaxID=1954 RepID=A0A917NTU7_9ACTN|nr:Xaa-Pro aminopeptidase [Streptomyces brasiliensis]